MPTPAGEPFDPALPCIVFMHGALNDHSVWTLLARWFAHHGFGVLAVDLPGHMRSEGPALPNVEAMADWAAGAARCRRRRARRAGRPQHGFAGRAGSRRVARRSA